MTLLDKQILSATRLCYISRKSKGCDSLKAVVIRQYGPPPDVLQLREVATPEPAEDEILIRLYASSVNPLDGFTIRGPLFFFPKLGGLLKPKHNIPGADFAGRVESVGHNIKRFRMGDEVFGASFTGKGLGGFAEFACAGEDSLAPKPSNLSFEEAAAVPVAAITALQGLRDHGQILRGQRVLIDGASGGVGTFAVQIAKSFGAEVTAVCSPRNVDRARAIGADHISEEGTADSGFSREVEPRGQSRLPGNGDKVQLYCALEKATDEVTGDFAHRGAAMQQARFVIDDDLDPGNNYDHRLMGFNNDPRTTFADVRRFFDLVQGRIEGMLESPPSSSQPGANPPTRKITEADIEIVRRVEAILDSPTKWDRASTDHCQPTAKTFGLYCAFEAASMAVAGKFDDDEAAINETRLLITNTAPNAPKYQARLNDYNNDPTVTLADLQRLLKMVETNLEKRAVLRGQ